VSELSAKELELVAIGAAVASNCVPCVEYHIPQARKAGLTEPQIFEAIRMADKVRQVPARKVLDVAMSLLNMHEQGTGTIASATSCQEVAAAGDEKQPCCG